MDDIVFIYWDKCSTCRKGKQFLDSNNIPYCLRDIMNETPNALEIKHWAETFQIPLTKFFNINGMMYRDLNLKDSLPSMSEEEILNLLSSNGKLLKRPILISKNNLILGYNEPMYQTLLHD